MSAPEVVGGALAAAERHLTRAYGVLTYKDVWLVAAAAAVAVAAAGVTPFAHVLREDAYNFAVKGMEIARGDFSLDRPQAIGWPLVLGLVYRVMSVENIFEAMFVSRWTSIACAALGVLALGRACRAVFPRPAYRALAVAIVVAYATAGPLFSMARSAMSEALFSLCVLGVVFFAARAGAREEGQLRDIAVAALLAAASYYVRPNGLFVFAALLVTAVLYQWGSARGAVRAASTAAAVFAACVAPYLYARFAAFGSPFDYGPNSKYFVEHYEHVWAGNIAGPTLGEFLAASDLSSLYARFVEHGALSLARDAFTLLLEPQWGVLAAVGAAAIFGLRRRTAYVVPVALAASAAGMSVVWSIFGTVRHLYYLLPLLLICAGASWFLMERFRLPALSMAATLVAVLAVSDPPALEWMGPDRMRIPQVQDHWAVWAANNMEGTVAIVEGGDLVKMSGHYARRGWRVPEPFGRASSRVEVWRPGVHDTLAQALEEFRRRGVTYLITDKESMKRRPYLLAVSEPQWRDHFEHLGYYHIGDKGSRVQRVNIYRVVY